MSHNVLDHTSLVSLCYPKNFDFELGVLDCFLYERSGHKTVI